MEFIKSTVEEPSDKN